MLNSRVWDPPAVREAQQRLAAGPTETVIAQAAGRWSACDVYIQADAATWGDQDPEFFLRTQSDNVLTEVFRARFSDLQFPYQPGGVGVGRISGILFSVRGRASDKFIFGALPVAADLPNAFFTMRTWGEDGFYADRNARPQFSPFAGRSQTLQSLVTPLVAGPNVIFPAHPQGRRNYITRIVIANDATDPVFGPMTLEDLDPATGVITPISAYMTGPDGGTWVQDEFTFPARGQLGGVWQLDAPAAPGGIISVSATGFEE